MENMMIYYGSSNMSAPQEPTIQVKSNMEEFEKTLKEGNYTRNE